MNGFYGSEGQWAVDSVFREIVIVFYLDPFYFIFYFLILPGKAGLPWLSSYDWDGYGMD